MKKRTVFAIFCAAFFLSIFALLCFGRSFSSYIKSESIPVQNTMGLHMDKALFYRQTLNNCGPYAVMAVLNVLKNQTYNPETLAAEMTWRMHKKLTFPQGLINLLHKYRVSTKEFLTLWNKGGYKIFFRNWALVC